MLSLTITRIVVVVALLLIIELVCRTRKTRQEKLETRLAIVTGLAVGALAIAWTQ